MAGNYSSSSLEQVPSAIALCGGSAGRAFGKVADFCGRGYSFEFALSRAAKSSESPLFALSCRFMAAAYSQGFETREALRRISAYIGGLLELRSEAANSLLISKYTILASAAFFVPFIIATFIRVGSSLSQADAAVLSAVFSASQGYLLLFSLIGGLFIGLCEHDLWKGLAYSAFCAPCGLAVFALFL